MSADPKPLKTLPSVYSDSDWDFAAALEGARVSPALYALVAHGLRPAAHHRHWLKQVRRAVETPGGRLLVVAPPGAAKSTYLSFVLPLWYLGRHPERAVLAITSSDAMSRQFHGTVALGLSQTPAHALVFPEDEARADPDRGWSTDGLYLRGVPAGVKDPSYRCSGFGASVIGSRAHCLLLDDPVTQETSTSPVEMQRVRQLLDMTLLPRLHPEGSALCITTRWGEEDVAAHLLKQGWDLLHTPALGDFDWLPPEAPRDEDGRGSLWPAQWSLEWLLRERARLGSAQWGTVWMGDPVPVGAGVFQAEWFRPYTRELAQALQGRLTVVAYVDLAWSQKQSADYTVVCTLGYDPRDPVRTLYVLSWFRKRVDEAGLVDALAEYLLQVRPRYIGVEVGAYRQAATLTLRDQLQQTLGARLATAVVAVPVATDKVTRARAPAAKAEAGQLYVDTGHPLWSTVERELLGFPMLLHDDCVDALSGATTLALEASQVAQQGQGMARPVRARFG